ncbi:uncharacterized protein B0J16DRAFT_328392 [Fusarium flagelliforme]|uniref:uncharacterized protein n=1 Tax=Fusarium flagelliforme TaxID=2675880 RepID=UPI001E8D9FAE|nr:uncharacterized protein B0J16DRAFT_328392 [Fusarium flagelliforme]KAH7197528.1 hypothetical protein B0J16DRAFT_328392 [Fusarium flagelliforme]
MVIILAHPCTHGNGLPISDCILSWRTPLWATPDSLLNNADAPLKLLLVCTLAWFHGITVEPSTFCIPCTAFAVRRACIGAKLTHALWCNLAEPKPGQDKTRLLVSYKIGETNRLSETLRQMTANTRMKINRYKALCDTVPKSLVRSSMRLHNANINNVVMFFLSILTFANLLDISSFRIFFQGAMSILPLSVSCFMAASSP